MTNRKTALGLASVFAAAVAIATPAPAAADDRDRDRGRDEVRERVRDRGDKYEYSYKDRHCEYKYKYEYRSRKTEIKQKGDCGHIAPPFRPVGEFPMPRTVPPVASPKVIGRCDREQLGQILGGIAGGAIGSQVGRGSGRTIATVSGVIIGVVVGGEIGRRMDEQDHACMSQALEFAQPNQSVQWGSRGGATYLVTPGAPASSGASICRPYETRIRIDGREQVEQGRACRQADGTWVRT